MPAGSRPVGSWTLGTGGRGRYADRKYCWTERIAQSTFTAVGTAGHGARMYPPSGAQAGGEVGPGSAGDDHADVGQHRRRRRPPRRTRRRLPTWARRATPATAPFGTCASLGLRSLIEERGGAAACRGGDGTGQQPHGRAGPGTIPGGGSVAIAYQAQVGVQASSGDAAVRHLDDRRAARAADLPRGQHPIRRGRAICRSPPGCPTQQKPGSVLIFNHLHFIGEPVAERQPDLVDQHQPGQSGLCPSLLRRWIKLHGGRSDRHPDPEPDDQLPGERLRSGRDGLSDRRGGRSRTGVR
jgi:hypothetical protein